MVLILVGMLMWSFSGAAFYVSITQLYAGPSVIVFLLGIILMLSGLKMMLMGLKDYLVSDIAASIAEIKTNLKK